VLSEVAQTADHVVIINAGRLRYAGALAELDAEGRSLEDAFLRLTASAP
jgi:ABC-type Na+ transport system ATPase subunit NatA